MSAASISVLLIEDTMADAELVRRMLSGNPGRLVFRVEHVDRLSAGLERLKTEGIDAILLDLNLPDGRGLELIDRAVAQISTVPIVILTGTFEEEQLAIQALQKGVQDYLFKDKLDGDRLARAICYAMERKRLEEEVRSMNTDLKLKISNIEWFGRIMMERRDQINDLREEVRSLREQLAKQASHPPNS